MPISYKEIRNERQWRATTGLNETQFNKLVQLFKETYEDFHESTLKEQISMRTDDVKFQSYEDILFFILYCLKSGSTYDVLALCFDLSRSVVFEQLASGVRLLQMTLNQNGDLPKREFSSFEVLQKDLDGYDELLIDVTEQRRQRPENQEVQKRNYSGKKKPTQ